MPEGRLGANNAQFQDACALIDDAITSGDIPGAVSLIWYGGHAFEYARGHAVDTDKHRIPVTIDTIYDCASLTKIVVTLPLLLMLVESDKLNLDDPVAMHMPEFSGNGKDSITIRQLLAHTSGLPPHRDLYSDGWSPDEIARHLDRMEVEYPPGAGCQYSCLGYIVLGRLIERVCGESLASAVERMLLKPLGMVDSGFNPPQEARSRIAATEYDSRLEEHCWGRVHDENAAALGGVAGNAGLFASARDLVRYARLWVSKAELHGAEGNLLSDRVIQEALCCQTSNIPNAKRGLGWVLQGDTADFAGTGWSASSFGHTGFTGTSIWIDPERDIVVVLLTNRVHYGRDKSISELRRQFHEAVLAAITE
ncbi:serine hydrolase domain-containing protein [Paenibacillus alvei]|uniref:serine hydrolase domain-containing protein n=1 Tax=Paenibacillus alvei TaxID=44250 RepID=UPI00227ED735|nr:serine hydrolase domain-containing protein [Paenibacillus alvei]